MKRKRNLKKETEELIMATQDQSSPPRWVKHYVIEHLILGNAECVQKWMKILAM